MPINLDTHARLTLFLLKDSPGVAQLQTPPEWNVARLSDDAQLLERVQHAGGVNQRMVLFVAEREFAGLIQLLRAHCQPGVLGRVCVVAVAKEPESFLQAHGHHGELYDVVRENEDRRGLELAVLRSLRSSIRHEPTDGAQRIGHHALERLNEVLIALSAERDPQRLIATILVKAIELTGAKGGTLYMVREKDGEMIFRLQVTNDRSQEVTFHHSNTKVVENSVCGYVALTGKMLNVPEVENLRPMSLPQFQKSVDHASAGTPVSFLTIPLKSSRNEVVAILQLANKMDELNADRVVAFSSEDESLLSSFCTQAAISLENADLYTDIQRLFDGFVKAAIAAIESRDPSTGGHSERVAKMSVALARATTEVQTGIYRSVRFREEEIRELEYAALLHDFGKIGVREEVLVKAKKLYPYQLEAIRERIKTAKASARIRFLEQKLRPTTTEDALDKELSERLRQLEAYWELVIAANEPTVLRRESRQFLEKIRSEVLILPDNTRAGLLSEEEYQALSVTQGSLTASERLEIESHVRHTYQFLKMIPWTKDFRHLAEIAYAHHEKLDGTGYPRGLTSHEISLQSKIMTIADIYDALTAADRWYKEAVPTEKALAILKEEVAMGKIDPVLVELFVEKKIFELTLPKALNQVA